MRYLSITLLILLCGVPADAQMRQRSGGIGFDVREDRAPATPVPRPSAPPLAQVAKEKARTPTEQPRPSANARTRRPAFAAQPARYVRRSPQPSADVSQIIAAKAALHRVDPRLVYFVILQESGFKPWAVSHAGASGYMQLMPGTAKRFGVTDIFDPEQNIDAGVRYLRVLLNMFGNRVDLALAGYNAGEGRVIRAGYRVPAIEETVNYVRAITARYGSLRHPY